MTFAKESYKAAVDPGMRCAKRCGNMYTGSIFGGLASLLSTKAPEELKDKKISMFAYGSGCAASFYSIQVRGDTSEIREKLDLLARLQSMKVVPCEDYVEAMKVRIKVPASSDRELMRNGILDVAPREVPQLCWIHSRRFPRQHLARCLLPYPDRRQVPSPLQRQGFRLNKSGCCLNK